MEVFDIERMKASLSDLPKVPVIGVPIDENSSCERAI